MAEAALNRAKPPAPEAALQEGDAPQAAAMEEAAQKSPPKRAGRKASPKKKASSEKGAAPLPEGISSPLEDTPVATAQEVLGYLTRVLRGEAEAEGRGGASSPRMKAAELLGRRLGLFSDAPEAEAAPVIVDDIPPAGGGA